MGKKKLLALAAILAALAAALGLAITLAYAYNTPQAGEFEPPILLAADGRRSPDFLEAEIVGWKMANPAKETPPATETETTEAPGEPAEPSSGEQDPAEEPDETPAEELALKRIASIFGSPHFEVPPLRPNPEPSYPLEGSAQKRMIAKYGSKPFFDPDRVDTQEIEAIHMNDLKYAHSDEELEALGRVALLGNPFGVGDMNGFGVYYYSTFTYANCVEGTWYYAATAHSFDKPPATDALAYDTDEHWFPYIVCTEEGVFGDLGSTEMLHDFKMDFGNPRLGEAYIILVPEEPREVLMAGKSGGPEVYKIQITGLYTNPEDGKNQFTIEFDDPRAEQFGAFARGGMSGSPIFQADEEGRCFKFVGALARTLEFTLTQGEIQNSFEFSIALWSHEMGMMQRYVIEKYYLGREPETDMDDDVAWQAKPPW